MYAYRRNERDEPAVYAPYVMREEEAEPVRWLTSKERIALAERFDPDKCGDYAGWNQHQSLGVPICDQCRAAYTEYQRQYRERRRLANEDKRH